MGVSRTPVSLNPPPGMCRIPSRTPGSLGVNDQGDPNVSTLLGDTPGSLGLNDAACTDMAAFSFELPVGAICKAYDGSPVALGFDGLGAPSPDRKSASTFSLGPDGLKLLKEIEELHLKPYDDQTRKDISAWVPGATIGYGHLILKPDWAKYKNGFSETDANSLFDSDLAPFVSRVRTRITSKITQNEFDALVILAFNIGPSNFASSSVVKLVNDPAAKAGYADLESAWKAWNKSQGKVMKGLENRRRAEWDIYAHGIYKRW